MSVLINMEMPKKTGAYSMKIRLFVREDGTASIWGLEEYIPNEPLDVIPVPPHGDLINRDALRAEFPEPNEENGGWRNPDEALVHKTDVWAAIDAAPTIIPAEEGE